MQSPSFWQGIAYRRQNLHFSWPGVLGWHPDLSIRLNAKNIDVQWALLIVIMFNVIIWLILSVFERLGHLRQMSRNKSIYYYQIWLKMCLLLWIFNQICKTGYCLSFICSKLYKIVKNWSNLLIADINLKEFMIHLKK